MTGKAQIYCITGAVADAVVATAWDSVIPTEWKEEKSGFESGCFGIERFILAIGTRCACFMHDLIPLGRQRCALFGASHPSVSAQLLRFWLYFMSPNCDWPGLLVASFHPGKEGSAPPWWAERFWWSPWLSDDLHLHRTVRDTSQVHPPLGWYGSQLTSTCLPGPAPPFTPSPPASLWEYLTYPTRLLLQRLNKTAPLFTNSSQGKHSFQVAQCKI